MVTLRSRHGGSPRRSGYHRHLREYNLDPRCGECRSNTWAGPRAASSSAPGSGRRREAWRRRHAVLKARSPRLFRLELNIRKLSDTYLHRLLAIFEAHRVPLAGANLVVSLLRKGKIVDLIQ